MAIQVLRFCTRLDLDLDLVPSVSRTPKLNSVAPFGSGWGIDPNPPSLLEDERSPHQGSLGGQEGELQG